MCGSPLTSLGLVRLSMPACPERSSPLASHTGPHRMSSLWSSRKGHSMEPVGERGAECVGRRRTQWVEISDHQPGEHPGMEVQEQYIVFCIM